MRRTVTANSSNATTESVDTNLVDEYLRVLDTNISNGYYTMASDVLFEALRSMDKKQLEMLSSILAGKAVSYARLYDNIILSPDKAVDVSRSCQLIEEAHGKVWTRLDNPDVPYADHELKTFPQPFQAVWDGVKCYEIRDNTDRDFEPGQVLLLKEYNPDDDTYTGRSVVTHVMYVSYGGEWGLPATIDVLSLEVKRKLHA